MTAPGDETSLVQGKTKSTFHNPERNHISKTDYSTDTVPIVALTITKGSAFLFAVLLGSAPLSACVSSFDGPPGKNSRIMGCSNLRHCFGIYTACNNNTLMFCLIMLSFWVCPALSVPYPRHFDGSP
jgi:hypothetical protein